MKARLRKNIGAIIICIIAIVAIVLSVTSYIHTKNYIALEDASIKYQLASRFYHNLADNGKLTPEEKQEVLPLLIWAGGAYMDRDFNKGDTYLERAMAILDEANMNVGLNWTQGTASNQTIVTAG